MRWLALVAILGAGCLDQLVPDHKKQESTAASAQPDLSPAPSDPNNNDPAPAGDDGGSTPAGDLATAASPADAGSTNTLLPFGSTCTVGTECESGLCENVMAGLVCTIACTNLGAADPACPANGQCNKMGYCK